jgi:hypothetical protein
MSWAGSATLANLEDLVVVVHFHLRSGANLHDLPKNE